MSTPFVCKSVCGGQTCGKPAARVYVTANAVRLVCDDCAAELKSAKGMLVAPPIVDVALLELIPAREALMTDNDRLRRLNRKTSQLLLAATEENNRLDKAYSFVFLGFSLAVITVWLAVSTLAAFIVGAFIIPAVAVARWLNRRWGKRRLDAINAECGYPEREK